MTLEQAFDPRHNSFNALRLLLASLVIVAHTYVLTGRPFPGPFFTGDGYGEPAVDGFFAISGFLITRSWVRRPRLGAYFWHRALRILPAFWVCLVVTAFVLAPIGHALSGAGQFTVADQASYVLNNLAIHMNQQDINGTPLGVPFPGYWNGSPWTLSYEVACYVGVAALGIVGFAKRRWTFPLLSLVAWAVFSFVTLRGMMHLSFAGMTVHNITRMMLAFCIGASLYALADRIPVNWPLVIGAWAATFATALTLTYQVYGGALFLGYAVIGTGSLVTAGWAQIRNDLSYGVYIYAYPIQQILASAGAPVGWDPIAFMAASYPPTFVLAAASWFLIEKRVLTLKDKGPGRRPAVVSVASD